MDVSKIGGKSGKTVLHSVAGAIPAQECLNSKSMTVMPISALSSACRVPDYAESLSNTSAGGARTVFSFGIIRALPGRPTVCHPAGNVLASRRGAQCARALSLSTACPHGGTSAWSPGTRARARVQSRSDPHHDEEGPWLRHVGRHGG